VLRRVSDYDVVSLIASNAIPSLPETYPIADDSAIEALVRTAADAAKDSDLIFVYISTHGTKGALTRKSGVFPEQSLSANGLAEPLQPLVGHRTVIFLSACYSGSLLDQLKSEDRIVVTAARLDRPSFGCKPAAQHTYFGEAGPAQLRTSRTELEADRARYHGGRSCPGASQQEYGFGTTGLRGTTHDEILHRTGILTPVIRTRRNAN